MCGRFTLTLEVSELQMAFDLGEQTVVWQPNYNIAPTQPVPVLTNQQPGSIQLFRWGLIPSWAKDPAIGQRMINARSETVDEKPSFRHAFASRRCVLLADGFYEWRKEENRGGKKPYYFHREYRKPFFFAGLWESWQESPASAPLQTCTILTCLPNQRVAEIHNRMPVILTQEEGMAWLDSSQPVPALKTLLKPAADHFLTVYEVSRQVNLPGNNSPNCIEPVQPTIL